MIVVVTFGVCAFDLFTVQNSFATPITVNGLAILAESESVDLVLGAIWTKRASATLFLATNHLRQDNILVTTCAGSGLIIRARNALAILSNVDAPC
jgi:hypothetical protein